MIKEKKRKHFSAEYIAFFCSEMRLIVKSGIPLEEALGIMSDEEDDADIAAILADISKKIGQGDPLQEAFRESGKFPDYMTDMITMGYSTGYLEEVFAQLARYYDRETRLRDSIRSAIAYPAVLFVMMVCVILILIIKVLPVFKSVFDQMGGNMSGMAAAIMNAGVLIKEHAAVSAAAAAALVVGLLLVAYKRHREGRITILMTRRLQRLEGSARFAAVMSMAVSSGLSINEAVDMAAGMDFDRDTHAAIVMIKDSMDRGDAFDDSLRESGLFSNIYNRMISLGAKSGNMDKVLEEVSEHMDRAVSEELDSLTGKIEPTMVIILSVITGIILLSVMLPLTDIMNTIG